MLLRFAVKNYRSIAEEQELLFTASGLSDEHVDLINVERTPPITVLPSVLIYGANASGKSNLLSALRFMADSVQKSHSGREPNSPVPFRPFLLGTDWKSRPMEFELDFTIGSVRYNYGFHSSETAFEKEWLYSYPKNSPRLLFERTSAQDVRFGPTLKGQNAVTKGFMRPNSLFLSTAAQYNHDGLRPISEFFSSLIFDDAKLTMPFVSRHLTEDRELTISDRVVEFLRISDTGVSTRRVLNTKSDEESKERNRKLQLGLKQVFADVFGRDFDFPDMPDEHQEIELGHTGENGDDYFLPQGAESTGTIRLVNTLPGIFKALELGTFIAIDELEMGLHTKAAELIVSLFASRETNPLGAQLLATTHDTNILDSKALRRDQVWFVEKTREGKSKFFPLYDFKVRKGDSMERGYLQGRFGAIPRGSLITFARGFGKSS